MDSTAARIAVAAGALGAAIAVAWLLRAPEPSPPIANPPGVAPAPAGTAPVAAPGSSAPRGPAPAPPPPRPDDDTTTRSPDGPAPLPLAAAAAGVSQEKLRRPLGKVHLENVPLGQVLEDLGKGIGVEVVYESEELRQWCWSKTVSYRMGSMSASRMLDLFLLGAGSPSEGKHLAWDPAGGKITILLRGGEPPREPPTDEATKEEKARTEKFLQRLRETKTTYAMEGLSLSEACSYLSARHGVDIVIDPAADERAAKATVNARATDLSLAEALDELLRADPDLRWEAKGDVVLVGLRK